MSGREIIVDLSARFYVTTVVCDKQLETRISFLIFVLDIYFLCSEKLSDSCCEFRNIEIYHLDEAFNVKVPWLMIFLLIVDVIFDVTLVICL